MPISGQIIPAWAHPHIETFINDNTVIEETYETPEEGVRGIYVFVSPKGRDNKIIPISNYNDFVKEFGKPNYKLHGQPVYMPLAALASGYAKAYCLRVMPEDAAYANGVLVAKVKVDDTDDQNKKLIIKHQLVSHDNLTNKDQFSTLTDLITSEDPDVDGFMTFPLFGVYSLGRGAYGNSMRFRLVQNLNSDKENGYKNYRLEVISTDDKLVVDEVFFGTFLPTAIVNRKSIFIEDVVNDAEAGSQKIGIYVCQESFEKIFEIFKTQVDPSTTLTAQTFDIITGKSVNGVAIPNVVIDNTTDNEISVDRSEGVIIAGGTDGSLTVNPSAPEVRQSTINTLYKKAFKGEIDPAILSKRRVPAELIFDANFDAEVKIELINLIIKRGDIFGYIDAGIINTIDNAIEWGEEMKIYADRLFSKQFQHYYIKDPFSGKNIPMTVTHFLASKLPEHFRTVGNHVPFAGQTNATLTGIIKDSLKPVLDADDEETKEKLYELGLNYFECVAENTYVRGVQNTSQKEISDLSEESNMHVTLEFKRILEDLILANTFNFADGNERAEFTEAAQRILNPYIGVKCRSASVQFAMSPYEEERNILHCYLSIIFKSIVKSAFIEIDINKRVN
mgnify:CR=1 FL=1